MGKRCDFTNVFPTVVVTSFANRLKFWPGNFPSWKFPLLPSALNQCRQTAKAKVNCNYGVGGWPPSSSGSARRSRGTKISPRKFPTKPWAVFGHCWMCWQPPETRACSLSFFSVTWATMARGSFAANVSITRWKGKFACSVEIVRVFCDAAAAAAASETFFYNCGLA